MGNMNRRTFLRRGTIAAAGGAVLAGPAAPLVAYAGKGNGPKASGYGPLQPSVDKTTGEVLLNLPKSFKYRTLGEEGSIMTDGVPTPVRHDGMAVFPGPNGSVRLVRNHEVLFNTGAIGDVSKAYDRVGSGGTTTLEVKGNGNQVDSWVSASGTTFNCSGGAMPYGTWVTCEESIAGPDLDADFVGQGPNLNEKHGYIYEVSASTGPNENALTVPIRAAGRFTHEGAAMDPATGVLYLTQDNFIAPSGLYRYLPKPGTNPMIDGHLSDDGALEMLAVVDGAGNPMGTDLFNLEVVGTSYDIGWVPIADPDPTFATTNPNIEISTVSSQGLAVGAAAFSRLEGIRYSNGLLYFTSTQGGEGRPGGSGFQTFGPGWGQVWALDIAAQQLNVIFQSPSDSVLELPDNLAVSPKGSLALCEDGDDPNFLRGLTPAGELFDFAQNVGSDAEFTGATFSPNGQALFFNIQSPGRTYMVWGPFGKGPF
jgi:secreted PhoX family phosphatase